MRGTRAQSGPPALGIFAGFGYRDIPFLERLRLIRRAGFDATCLWWEDRPGPARRLRHLAPSMIRDTGLLLDSLHAPYHLAAALWNAEPEVRLHSVERHLSWVRDCARHGVPQLVVHVYLGRSTGDPNGYGAESLRRIVSVAEDAGIQISIENTRSTAHVDYLLESIDSPSLGLCYDVAHDWLYSDRPFELLGRWRHRLCGIHISDCDGRRDRHWLPGSGSIDFARFADKLGVSAADALMLEVVPRSRRQSPEAFLQEAYLGACTLKRNLQSHSTRVPERA